jgi:hypothetical protein
VIDGPGQHPPELRPANALLERGRLRRGLGNGRLVVLGGAEVEQDDRVVEVARELLDAREPLLEPGALARDRLRLLLVVPEAGSERLLLELVDFRLQLRKVKDAPLAP